jgi:hypothetical protein
MTAVKEHMFEEVKPTFMAKAALLIGTGAELEPLAAGATVDGGAVLLVTPKPEVVVVGRGFVEVVPVPVEPETEEVPDVVVVDVEVVWSPMEKDPLVA